MSKYLRKPAQEANGENLGRFERFMLSENPFPSEPVVNKESSDKRINGDIYEVDIRKKEYQQILDNFIKQSQGNPNHLRLGFIIDTSYIGRGNGKSAFLVNLQQLINHEFCLDLTGGQNKCFAAYVTPEPGGRTKTFPSFVDLLVRSMIHGDIIKSSLASLRLSALDALHHDALERTSLPDDQALVQLMNSREWFESNHFDLAQVNEYIFQNKHLQGFPSDFPLFRGRNSLIPPLATQEDFQRYYFEDLKKGRDRLDFVFSHLVKFLQAAGFNGAYILVDDFERIPDFQSARQKRDFALELRSCLFDGMYVNAKSGFYNLLLVLHAGVPQLISDAWGTSGMENRVPLTPLAPSKHIIKFEKLSKDDPSILLKKYLSEYRIDGKNVDALFPFTMGAISKIGELSEFNAAKILKMAYALLDRASEIPEQATIDEKFVMNNRSIQDEAPGKKSVSIEESDSTDLKQKARGHN